MQLYANMVEKWVQAPLEGGGVELEQPGMADLAQPPLDPVVAGMLPCLRKKKIK